MVQDSVELDGQVCSVFAEKLAVVVVDGPEGGQVLRLHGEEEVLPPAALQTHETREAPLGVSAHHLQPVRHVGLVKNPSGGETSSKNQNSRIMRI